MRRVSLLVALLVPGFHAHADDLASFNAAVARGDCVGAQRVVNNSPRRALLRGIQFETGACSSKDEVQALAQYRLAAQAKDNDARYSFFVLVGRKGAGNEVVSKELWKEAWGYVSAAADARHPKACRVLADAYQHGFEVEKNRDRSIHYRSCAE